MPAPRPIGRRLACALALAGACVLGFGIPSATQAAEVGVVSDITWGQSRADIDREIEMLEAAGVEWVRATANWTGLEGERKGAIHSGLLADYDYGVDKAIAAGMKVLMPISDGVPYWASSDPDKRETGGQRRWNAMYPPQHMSDYGDFAGFIAEHFRGRVSAYEIWNEPNHAWFWRPSPDAGEYVKMLREGSQAVRAADPAATVLLGGLSRNDFVFLEQVYAAGGGPYFDAVAVHPYSYDEPPRTQWYGRDDWEPLRKGDPNRLSWNCFPAIKEIRASMVANGDGAKDVWLTEFGWSTTTQNDGVSEELQAKYLTQAYAYADQFPWVKTAFWYMARNNPFWDDADEIDGRYGLFTTNFEPKPSYHALQSLTQPRPVEIDARKRWKGRTRAGYYVGGSVDEVALEAARARQVSSTDSTTDTALASSTDGPTGEETTTTPPPATVYIERRRHGRWKTLARKEVVDDGSFKSAGHVWIGRRIREVRLRARVPGVGASRLDRIPVR